MARYSAVRHNKQKARQWARKHFLGKRTREITVKVTVRRGEFKTEAAYEADACVIPNKLRTRGGAYPGAKRCNYGHGKTPTSAIKNALTGMTRKLK
jgi:hypothetical protein